MSVTPASPHRLIIGMCLAQTLGMLGIFAFPALLPHFFAIWDLSNTQAGWINGIYFAGYAAGVPVLVGLTDRIDARRIYLAGAAVGTAAALGFALLADGFGTALGLRALAGLGLAGTYIPGLRALVDRSTGPARDRAIAFYTATFSLGAGASFWVTDRVAAWLDWRWAFAVGALGAGLALALAAVVLAPRPPPPPGDRRARSLLDFRPVLRNPGAMAYIIAYSVHTWELFAFRSWVVAYLAFSATRQPRYAGFVSPAAVATLASLVSMWASIGGAELAVRFGRRRTVTGIMLVAILTAGCLGFLAGWAYPLLAGLCVVYACLGQGDSAAIHGGVVAHAVPQHLGLTMGFQSLLGFSAAFIGPLAFGVILDASGSWGLAFLLTGLVAVPGMLCLAVLLPGGDPRNTVGQ